MATELEEMRIALREKEDQIVQLQAQVQFAEELFAKLHARAGRSDDSGLPVPRLELRWVGRENDSEGEWEYNLVLNHFTGQIFFFPLGSTDVSGGADPFQPDGKIKLPFRDGAHIRHDMQQLQLPAFAIRGTQVDRLNDA